MTAQLIIAPEVILSNEFTADDLHPADLEQIIIAAYDYYQDIPAFTKLKKMYRLKYNQLVELLEEKRDFRKFAFLR